MKATLIITAVCVLATPIVTEARGGGFGAGANIRFTPAKPPYNTSPGVHYSHSMRFKGRI